METKPNLFDLITDFEVVDDEPPPRYIVFVEYNINDGQFTRKGTLNFDSDDELINFLVIAKSVAGVSWNDGVVDQTTARYFEKKYNDEVDFYSFYECDDYGNCFPIEVKRIHHHSDDGKRFVASSKF